MVTWFWALGPEPATVTAFVTATQLPPPSTSLCCKVQPVAGAGHEMTTALELVGMTCNTIGCVGCTSATVTVKLFVALNCGWPLSVTMVTKVLLPSCAEEGVHVITPRASIAAPSGGGPSWTSGGWLPGLSGGPPPDGV